MINLKIFGLFFKKVSWSIEFSNLCVVQLDQLNCIVICHLYDMVVILHCDHT